MHNALISGITRQDDSHLAELLLHKGCREHGIIRRASSFNTCQIGQTQPPDAIATRKVRNSG